MHDLETTPYLAERIRAHVEALCAIEDRNPGTAGNRASTDYVLAVMRDLGLVTQELHFEVPEWQYGVATVHVHDVTVEAHPGPFSGPVKGTGELRVITHPDDLSGLDARGMILLLAGEIARIQFTARDYPFYQDAGHAAILDALEAARPVAVLAATGKNPAMTAAMSPFPLIEEVRFSIPTAYMTVEDGVRLAVHNGERTSVRIDSETHPSSGVQPVGRMEDTWPGRIVVAAHVDSKPGTRGALDNAAGVAVILVVAALLRDRDVAHTVEFVPFNGEDHVMAPGELAYLGACDDLKRVRLMINVDGAGLPGGPNAYSLYGVDDTVTGLVARVAEEFSSIVEGPQWPASDHMVFVMRGVPAMALTSEDFATASGMYAHSPEDTPHILDYESLAETARFIAQVIEEL